MPARGTTGTDRRRRSIVEVRASAHEIVVAICDGLVLLDLSTAIGVFYAADRLRPEHTIGYRVSLVGQSRSVRTLDGVEIQLHRTFEEVATCDTLIVLGTSTSVDAVTPALLAQLRRIARSARRVVSFCFGAYLLAEAGLLDGKRATTHWAGATGLRRRYPRIRVEADQIFVRDGALWTSAGGTAGIDLSLALVEEDLGSAVAASVARWLVVYLRRPGTQSQYSVALASQSDGSEPIRAAQTWALANLDQPLSLEDLARRAHLSVRQFSRRFRAETGRSPAAWLDAARLDLARQLLETTDQPLKRIATLCGYASSGGFSRAFRRAMSISPGEFRARFGHRQDERPVARAL